MPNLSASLASGDPLQLVFYWASVALAALIAWFLIAIVFLPFYFGIKTAVDLMVSRVRHSAFAIAAVAHRIFGGIVSSFGRLGTANEVKVFLQSDIRSLRHAIDAARVGISKQFRRYRRVTERVASTSGGVPGVMRRVNQEIDRLQRVPQLDAESIKTAKGRSVAWFRAILITAFWIGIVALNTIMLHEFFKGLIPFRIALFGLTFEVAWAISIFYTFVEFIFGFLLERTNEKREGAAGVSTMQLVLVPFILIAIAVEVALYTILSFDIQWAWPEAIATSMPPWADGWLGALGLVIGGGVVFSGYFMGAQWAEVLRNGSVISMKAQARLLSHSLDGLPERLHRLKEAVSLAQGRPDPTLDTVVIGHQSNLTSEIERGVNLLNEKLEAVSSARKSFPPVEDASNHEARRFRWKVLALGAGGVVAVIGNGLRMTTALSSTEIGNLGPLAPPAFATVATVLMLFAGRIAATTLVVTHGRVASDNSHESHLNGHGLGITQWAGIALALLLLVFSAWAGTNGFATMDIGGLSSSLAVSVATFMVGAFLEDIVRGLAFFVEVLARCVAGGALGLVALLALVASWILAGLLFTVEILSGPALWLWRTFRGPRARQSTEPSSEPQPRQLSASMEQSKSEHHLELGEARA